MSIFRFFKFKPKCRHYKEAGMPVPKNMKTIIRFGDSEKRDLGHSYGISECSVCGTRAFSCFMGCAPFGGLAVAIDDFIAKKISMEDFVKLWVWTERVTNEQ